MSDDRTRRRLLRATAGFALVGSLVGCLGGSSDGGEGDGDDDDDGPIGGTDGDGSDGETDSVGSPEGRDQEDGTGSAPVTECPMLPGSYSTHDTGATPLPVDFEYPSAMDGSWSYLTKDNFDRTNTITGRIERGSQQDGDGDIKMAIAVKYNGRGGSGRQRWYDRNRTDKVESTVTTTFNGESVDFLLSSKTQTGTATNNAWNAFGMVPYQPEHLTTPLYFMAVASIETLLYRADASDVSESCGDNQRAALEQTVESFSLNQETTFGDYVDY